MEEASAIVIPVPAALACLLALGKKIAALLVNLRMKFFTFLLISFPRGIDAPVNCSLRFGDERLSDGRAQVTLEDPLLLVGGFSDCGIDQCGRPVYGEVGVCPLPCHLPFKQHQTRDKLGQIWIPARTEAG